MKCISCSIEHSNNFCPNCGEKKDIKRLTFSSIFEYTFLSITNMDKGFLYNLKSLITNPKQIVTLYTLGKRKNILNPISFLILSISIYLIVESFFKLPTSLDNSDLLKTNSWYKISYYGGKFFRVYFNFFWAFSIFPLSILTKTLFKKFNYSEHLVINSFILGLVTLLSALSHSFFRLPLLFDIVMYISLVILIYRVFKTVNNKIEVAILSFITVLLFALSLFLIIVLIGYVASLLN